MAFSRRRYGDGRRQTRANTPPRLGVACFGGRRKVGGNPEQAMARCIITVVCAIVFLVSLKGAAKISAAKPGERFIPAPFGKFRAGSVAGVASATRLGEGPSRSGTGAEAKAFTLDKDGGYAFDTGILRGQLLQAGKTLGLSSVVHVPSGVRLDGAFGIASYYRLFTTNTRYGTAAWDWPSTSKLLPDGAVQVTWPEGPDRPFEMAAIYRFHDSSTLDVETIVKPSKDLSNFEVFLASYFREVFPSPFVYVAANRETQGKPGFLLAKKSFGDWQMFPRNQEVLPVIQDGRWQKEPNPVRWVIMPSLAAPVCLRRGAGTDLVVVLMAPPGHCFAIATPYEGESHYSLYLSLFGRDVKAAETAKARSRFTITTGVSDRQILELYRSYTKEFSGPPLVVDGQ